MWGRGGRSRWVGAAVLTGLVSVVAAGCQVSTSVAVRVQRNGSGAVTVIVDADRAATAAVGGLSQLQVADLTADGWTTSTRSGRDGSTVVTVSHPFSRLSEVPAILADVGRAPTGAPLFVLDLRTTVSASTVTTSAVGTMDLSCGLSCFGDTGLERTYGSELGLDPQRLVGPAAAAAAAHDFHFTFSLSVPGRVTSSDATSAPEGAGAGPTAPSSPGGSSAGSSRRSTAASSSGRSTLQWTAALGRRVPLQVRTFLFDGSRGRVPSPAGVTPAGGTSVVLFALVLILLVAAVRACLRVTTGLRAGRRTLGAR